MKRGWLIALLALIPVGALLASAAGCRNFYADAPKNYDECITKNMKGVTQTRTRILVEKGCRTEFPERQY